MYCGINQYISYNLGLAILLQPRGEVLHCFLSVVAGIV